MITVHTLGTALIEAGDFRLTPISPRKFPMLLHLSAEAGRWIPRAEMFELIFPERDTRSAGHSLRELIYKFRQAGLPIETDNYGMKLDPAAVRIDWLEVVNANQLTPDQLRAIEGGFLPGYSPDHSEAFAGWFEVYRVRAIFDLCKSLIKEAARTKELADWRTAERAARACLTLDPFNDEATLSLSEVLAAGGAKTQATQLLDRYVADVGKRQGAADLKVPAAALRRRVAERIPDRFSSRTATPFVGRDREMIELRECLRLAESGANQCVVIVGEPGIGKSRIAAEFATVATLNGAEAGVTFAQPNDLHRPFAGFADLMPKLLQMRGALGCAPSSMEMAQRLIKRTDASPSSFADSVRDSELLSDSISTAIVDVVESIAAEQPLVLVIEDSHSLDEMSGRVLARLLTRRGSRRVLALLTSRESMPVISRSFPGTRTFELGPLSAEAIDRITSSVASSSHVGMDAAMRTWLEETSGGNPLFLESLLAHYVASGEPFTISPELSHLLAARMKSLSPEAAITLRVCALLGRHSTIGTALEVLQLKRYDLLRAVTELETARLIRFEDGLIRPSHALVGDVATRMFRPVEKRLAHQMIASALESLVGTTPLAGLAWDCAEHWRAASNPERAFAAIQRCADYAIELGRPSDAAQVLSRALDLELAAAHRLEIAHRMIISAHAAAESTLVLRGIEECRQSSTAPLDHDDIELAAVYAELRQGSTIEERADQLLTCISSPSATPNHRVEAATLILKSADRGADLTLARDAVAALSQDALDAADDLVRLEHMVVRLSTLGDFGEALPIARALMAAAQTASLSLQTRLHLNAGLAFLCAGSATEAIEAMIRSYNCALAVGMHRSAVIAATALNEIYSGIEDDERAEEWFARADSLTDGLTGIGNDFPFVLMSVQYPLSTDRTEIARRAFEQADARNLFSGSPLRRRWKKALETRLRQLQGEFETEVRECEDLSDDPRRWRHLTTLAELETINTCHGLMHYGRLSEACSYFDRFERIRNSLPEMSSRGFRAAKRAFDKLRSTSTKGTPPAPLASGARRRRT